mmetsp:Transcript_671/g.1241  ORF Transcript_671/g.1241 Transcript_671/m.1241 type:complete len:246 (+) Transcript_671:154-891(+)
MVGTFTGRPSAFSPAERVPSMFAIITMACCPVFWPVESVRTIMSAWRKGEDGLPGCDWLDGRRESRPMTREACGVDRAAASFSLPFPMRSSPSSSGMIKSSDGSQTRKDPVTFLSRSSARSDQKSHASGSFHSWMRLSSRTVFLRKACPRKTKPRISSARPKGKRITTKMTVRMDSSTLRRTRRTITLDEGRASRMALMKTMRSSTMATGMLNGGGSGWASRMYCRIVSERMRLNSSSAVLVTDW